MKNWYRWRLEWYNPDDGEWQREASFHAYNDAEVAWTKAAIAEPHIEFRIVHV